MAYPTFWFSNSGINWEFIKQKICCYKDTSSDNTLEYEWDIHEGYTYSVETVQPLYLNKL